MLYGNTYDNIAYTIRSCFCVTPAQLARFFSEEMDWPDVKNCLTTLLSQCTISYDTAADMVTWRGGLPLKTTILAKRIYSFWVIAAMGSSSVGEIIPMEQPGQFLVIDQNRENAYDITLIENKIDCDLAYRLRKMYTADMENDSINHIALLKDIKLAEQVDLRRYSFDSYCVYNKDNMPVYYQLD